MRVITFKPCFVPLVESGEKLQTIRKHARCKPGDSLSLRRWVGRPYLSKQVIIREAICEDVSRVVIDGVGIVVNGHALDAAEAAVFALADGFETEDDLLDFFSRTHGFPFTGELIKWGYPMGLCWEELKDDIACGKTGCRYYDLKMTQHCGASHSAENDEPICNTCELFTPATVQLCSTLSAFATKKHRGVLDRCECGAVADFKLHHTGVSVDCCECPNGTGIMPDDVTAMVSWNKAQRQAKGGEL